ncbi:MAG: metalloregulator ArsR/SmtB family transcription factor [Gemmatimonadaceae bacterium]
MLDLLAQAEMTVERLAEKSRATVKNTSAHLRVLRQAFLVETRREGTFIRYRLADEDVTRIVRDLQQLGRRRLAEVEHVKRLYLDDRDALDPVTLQELRALVRDGHVTVIDVRPYEVFEAAHIPGARSFPLSELKRRMRELPKRREIVAYCRGPYCVFALEAVTLLRKRGFRVLRAEEGIAEWRAAGLSVAAGA